MGHGFDGICQTSLYPPVNFIQREVKDEPRSCDESRVRGRPVRNNIVCNQDRFAQRNSEPGGEHAGDGYCRDRSVVHTTLKSAPGSLYTHKGIVRKQIVEPLQVGTDSKCNCLNAI